MDLKEIRNAMAHNEKVYVPAMKKFIIINEIKEENGRKWAYATDKDGKDIRVDIRHIQASDKVESLNEPTPFPKDKEEQLEKREKIVLDAIRLLGRNKKYVLQVFKPELENAIFKTMMVKVSHSSKKKFKNLEISKATVRAMHYANTALTAGKIEEGIQPNDKELKEGIEVAAIGHDWGQTPFGHDGEAALNKALKSYNGGDNPHSSEGAKDIIFRYYNQLKDAILKGEIIENEARKRIKVEPNKDNLSNAKRLKEKIKEINENLEIGLEPDLQKLIKNREKDLGSLVDESIKILAMAAGNHNGERGRENIKPDYSITFDEFMDNIKKSYIYFDKSRSDDEYECEYEYEDMKPLFQSCTIADAIAKLSDQISSIPFDMIDGVRSGIEDKIPESWIIPLSQLLHIPQEEAIKKLSGDEKQLKTLALEIQDHIIKDVVRNSNQRELNMSIETAESLYGLNGKTGLREPNMEEHIHFTTLPDEQFFLDNFVSDLIDKLVQTIVDKDGIFDPEMNAIFRIERDNPNRKFMENKLKSSFRGNEYLKDFFNYCAETSSEEYYFNKSIVKAKELNFYRRKFEKAFKAKKKHENSNDYQYLTTIGNKQSVEYAIGLAFEDEDFQIIQPDENGKYSEEKTRRMIENLNAFYKSHPEYNINSSNLKVSATKVKKSIEDGEEVVSKRRRTLTRDQQIAARFAVSYVRTLNDYELLDLANNLKIITDEEKALAFRPYAEYSEKRKGGKGVVTDSASRTAIDYKETTTEEEKGDK